MSYEIDLAREIIEKKETERLSMLGYLMNSEDKDFLKYKDEYIKVIAAKNTKAMEVTIYTPLTTADSNPIIYVDDEGKCYRNHGERGYFVMYAERLLEKEITLGSYEQNQSIQEKIDKLFTCS